MSPATTDSPGETIRALAAEAPSGFVRGHLLGERDGARYSLAVARLSRGGDWARFERAARRRSSLRSPLLLPLLSVGRDGERAFAGFGVDHARPLSALLPEGRMHPVTALEILEQAATAACDALAAGVPVHELNPDTVFVADGHSAQLADLGLARAALGSPPGASEPHLAFVAPEVIAGQPPDPRSVVYSLGALLFATQTAQAPNGSLSALHGARTDLPAAFDAVVLRALAPDPADRFGDGLELVAAARTALAQASPRALGEKPAAAAVSAPRKLRLPARPRNLRLPARPRNLRLPARPRNLRLPARPRNLRLPALPDFAGVAAFVVAGVVAFTLLGVALASQDDADPPQTFKAELLRFTIPGDWKAGGAAAPPDSGGTIASPETGSRAGLAGVFVEGEAAPDPSARPVRLGRNEAWREAGVALGSGVAGNRYTIPTEGGALVLTCFAARPDARATLPACERIVSTVVPQASRPIPLTALAEVRAQLAEQVERLSTQRAALRARLADAERQAGQAALALSLAELYEAGAGDLGPGPLADALSRAALSYRRMSNAAAADDRAAWRAAADQVDSREAGLVRALETSG